MKNIINQFFFYQNHRIKYWTNEYDTYFIFIGKMDVNGVIINIYDLNIN